MHADDETVEDPRHQAVQISDETAANRGMIRLTDRCAICAAGSSL